MENDGVLEGWQIIFHIRRSRKKIRWTEWRSKIISTVENKTLEQSLSVVKWSYANQTVKILSRLFYEQTNSIEKYEWVETKEEGLENLPSQKDFKKLEEIIVGVASYLTCFEIATEEQKVDDSQYSQEIFDVLLNEIGLTELNPLLDKILAYAVIVFINTSNNLKDVEANVKKLGEGVQSILKAFNQFAEDSNYKANNSDRANSLYDIDTSALEIGMVIKNYKELCRLLNQEVKSGKAKRLQLEEFKRYFDFEKSGQKFIITDIYDTPLTIEDRRKLGNNSIYVKYIEMILLQYLAKQEGYTRTFTKRNWWGLLGMVNKKYNRIAPKQLEKIDYTITPFEINNFYQRCNKKLEQILFSALNNLKNRKLILWELQTVIVVINENGKEVYFLADDEEKKRILQVERYILKNVMGYEKIFQIFSKNKQIEYYQKVNEKLYELYGWHHYFKQIKLIYTPEDVIEAIQQSEIELQKEILNEKIITALNDNAKEKYDTENKKWEETCKNLIWGDYRDSVIYRKWLPDTYIEAQRILTDELINIGHKENKILLQHFEEDDELNQIFNSFMC